MEAGAGGLSVPTLETPKTGINNGGHLLFILTSRDVQSVADLALASGQSSTDTIRSLGRLAEQGFLVVADQSGTAVYQLRPKAEQVSVADLPEHVLLIEDDVMISEVVVTVLEEEGYAVVACLTPLHAVALLERISFDLVITDGFSRVPGAVFVNTADVIRSAGVTPVALFSAHTLDLGVRQSGWLPRLHHQTVRPGHPGSSGQGAARRPAQVRRTGSSRKEERHGNWQRRARVRRAGAGHRKSDPSRRPEADGHRRARVGTLGGDVSAIIQERPALMFGLLTALTGAVGTTWLATRVPRHQTMRRRLRRGRKQFGAALTLLPLAVEVLSKPSVKAYLRRTMMRELSRRLGR